MRLVLDTNIIVSALLWRGAPYELMVAARRQPIALFTSPVLLAELAEVLTRKKLAAAVAATRATPDQLMQRYQRLAVTIQPASIPPTITADPDDDDVIACGLAAKADFIVSGDEHLLALKQYQGIPIVTPPAALKRLAAP